MWWIAFIIGFVGCAGASRSPARENFAHAVDRQTLHVPFFPDRSDQCGPSVLASVLAYWNYPVDLPAIREDIYLKELRGSLPVDLLLAAQKRGLTARFYKGSIEDLQEQLSLGHPLIAFLNRGFDFLPIGHFVVVTGFDDMRQGLYVHSSGKKDHFVTYRHFRKSWDKTERSTLLILPPGGTHART